MSSEERAKKALPNLLRWKDSIKKEAKAINVPASLVAAIISRETDALDRFCLPPQEGGKLGDKGYGHGPMQIDKRSFPEWCTKWREGKLTTADGIAMGCTVLKQKMRSISRLVPEMPEDLRLRAAVAAYNCGEGNVRKAYRAQKSVDAYTAHANYSQDVLERAKFFASVGFDDGEQPSSP